MFLFFINLFWKCKRGKTPCHHIRERSVNYRMKIEIVNIQKVFFNIGQVEWTQHLLMNGTKKWLFIKRRSTILFIMLNFLFIFVVINGGVKVTNRPEWDVAVWEQINLYQDSKIEVWGWHHTITLTVLEACIF